MSGLSSRPSSVPAWRRAGTVNFILISALVLCMLALQVLVAATDRPHHGTNAAGSLILQGNCEKSSRVNMVLHGLINIVSSLVLGSSNYFMQVLSAPAREQVDHAHMRGDYVEIGVMSLRNLMRSCFSVYNRFAWIILALSSIPLHLFFNALVYHVNVSTSYQLIITADSFLNGGNFSSPGVGQDQYDFDQYEWNYETDETWDDADDFLRSLRNQASSWDNLTITDCMDIYDRPKTPLTTHRHLILIVGNPDEAYTEGWKTADMRVNLPSHNLSDAVNSLWLIRGWWMVDEYIGWMEAGTGVGSWQMNDWLSNYLDLDSGTGIIKTDGSAVSRSLPALEAKYCLSERIDPQCEIRAFRGLMATVFVFTLLKAIISLVTLWRLRSQNLLMTPGDAMQSFIIAPDPSTSQMCWISADSEEMKKGFESRNWPRGPRQWTPRVRRLASVVPRSVWFVTYIWALVMIVVAAVLLGTGTKKQPIMKSSFGDNRQTRGHYVNIGSGTMSTMQSAIIANLPQVAVSVGYLGLNAIMTRMQAEGEWSDFARKCQPLRVSSPTGLQQGTYRLQLPYRWSIPFLLISTLLHWLVSQCIFLKVNIGHEEFPPYGVDEIWSGTGLGYSSLTVLITLIVCFLEALVPPFMGLRKLPQNMVTAASNSVILSAACHGGLSPRQLEPEDNQPRVIPVTDPLMMDSVEQLRDLSQQQLKWGEVTPAHSPSRPGHLGLGTQEAVVGAAVEGGWYGS